MTQLGQNLFEVAMGDFICTSPSWLSVTSSSSQCTVFREAYILSGSGFHEFLYSIIKSFKKIVKLLSLFLISCVFTEKTLANFHDMEISLVVLPCHFID